ncbi:LOW QUALITY PROTEIN: interleukin-6 receptor subunit beta-like [Electrophorus electricus]|uniref:LOW QUALITY PROTEIN: interleukin-6 receptor subunit beta-like n=1 Tax=Electrophorus electricus TaxID=8005 RepID=UPI0015CFFD69|nr:LOW QUALITY PROTEIN: interleukin-6 receptor subunit beta-like [Electrophorus electricus]
MRIPLHSTLLFVSYFSFSFPLDLPIKPENLQCIALQKGKRVSPNLTCHWDPGEHAPDSNTSYILYAQYSVEPYSVVSYKKLANNLTVDLGSFPIYMETKVWVEVKNELGSVNSTELLAHAECFVKPNPPSNVMLIPEANFSMSLIVNWTHSFYLKLKYNIRYCQAGSSVWNEVPQSATESYIESFRLQFLQPYTDYVVQMRCINQKGIGYWSDWSPNATARTPEAKPESKSDLWRVYEEKNNTVVKLIWKDPVKSNGKILGYNITVEENGVSAERHVVHSKEHQLHIKGEKMFIRMTAHNSAGVSPVASLVVPRSMLRAGAEQVRWSVRDGQLWVDWLPPSGSKWLLRVFEYVLEWVSVPEGKRDCRKSWPKKKCQLLLTYLLGNFEPFVRYKISVSIYGVKHSNLYYNLPGDKVTVEAYLKQGPPLRGPSVEATETQKTVFHLKWEEIPVTSQRGFLTNYTIFYKTGDNEQFVVVRSEFHSHKLTELASASRYVVCVMASNMEGSVNGSESILYTKYDVGELEVMVCLGFLVFVLFIMIYSLKKRESIKNHFWPHIPNPSHSTIANWSPDCPTRVNILKIAKLPDLSIMEVGMFDGKSLCEEDKTVLPLKKDKYFSEEHSSGIGGSSCMSSPRQSVSDNDEGDSCQTTASTMQYSSVVASGYKGQTPSLQAPVFARSESTQPLLESEEHPEHLLEGSRHWTSGQGIEQQQMQEGKSSYNSLNFCPVAKKKYTPTLTEDPPGLTPCYMPQQSGH